MQSKTQGIFNFQNHLIKESPVENLQTNENFSGIKFNKSLKTFRSDSVLISRLFSKANRSNCSLDQRLAFFHAQLAERLWESA